MLVNLEGETTRHKGLLKMKLTCKKIEYAALITGLGLALKSGAKYITMQGDSKLICCQVTGKWQLEIEILQPYL